MPARTRAPSADVRGLCLEARPCPAFLLDGVQEASLIEVGKAKRHAEMGRAEVFPRGNSATVTNVALYMIVEGAGVQPQHDGG